MADVTFTGFVDDWTKNNPQHPAWGMRVTEPHRKKDGDQWVTVSRTVRTVKAAFGVTIDFSTFPKGSRVVVTGKEMTETSERDGRTYDNLVVKAETVEILSPGTSQAAPAAPSAPAGIPTSWEPVQDTELPF